MIDYYKENGKFPLETQEDLKNYKTIPITRGYGFVKKYLLITYWLLIYKNIPSYVLFRFYSKNTIQFVILRFNFTCIKKKDWVRLKVKKFSFNYFVFKHIFN